MINFNPKFVSVDDFKNFTGYDLREKLRDDDNVSNQAERFLMQVEDHLMTWIDKNTFRVIRFEDLRGSQLESFQKAILSQALYTYKNGAVALGLESGYDSEKGIMVDFEKLQQIEVCNAAVNYLMNAGLLNFKIKNRIRTFHGLVGTELLHEGGIPRK